MDQIIKAKWIAALRSGKYTQGRDKLESKTTGNNCCLGVLCRVLNIPASQPTHEYKDSIRFKIGLYYQETSLPIEFLIAYGITKKQQDIFIGMNDGDSSVGKEVPARSFDHIAGYIEAMM